MLGGRLTSDFVAERVGHSVFGDIRELDLPQLSLKSIDLGTGEVFVNLRSINLEHNNLTSMGGLIYLPNLRVRPLSNVTITLSLVNGSSRSIFIFKTDAV